MSARDGLDNLKEAEEKAMKLFWREVKSLGENLEETGHSD